MSFSRTAVTALCLTLAFGTFAPFASAEEPTGGLRYTIVVTQFTNESGWKGRWDLGQAWGTVLTDMLNESGRFIVLGEQDMRGAALSEQDFASSGRTAGGAKSPATGQMTPAQLLVKGKITHVENTTSDTSGGLSVGGLRLGGKGGKGEINVTVYIVDSSTGIVLASKNVIGVSSKKGISVDYYKYGKRGSLAGFENDNVGKAVQNACSQVVTFLTGQLPKIPWTGSVAEVVGSKIYVNRGSREGLSSGQMLLVGDAKVIRDPDTGEVLDNSVDEVARLEVTDVKEKVSICKVVKGNAASIRKGMQVLIP